MGPSALFRDIRDGGLIFGTNFFIYPGRKIVLSAVSFSIWIDFSGFSRKERKKERKKERLSWKVTALESSQ